jgi:ABC-type glycerol-3-phosphate transport system substrate-binding protein
VVIDEPEHEKVLAEFLRIFGAYHLVPPDTINYSFNEMYQVIEGGRVGMFRVGDWNVAKWDSQAIKGDFEVGPWPRFFADKQNAVVIGGMRGVAVPENAPDKALAIEFAAFLLSRPAQQASLNMVGSAVRKDLDVTGLSERQKMFAQPKWALIAYDFPEATLAWYPELEAAFHRKLLGAIANPPADVDAFIRTTATEMREMVKQLSAKKG